MPDNDFWIGQEQIPVDLSLLLTYHNDEDYWYAPLPVTKPFHEQKGGHL